MSQAFLKSIQHLRSWYRDSHSLFWKLLILLLIFRALGHFYGSYQSPELFSKTEVQNRVFRWIEIANCSLEQGHFLFACNNENKMIPFENYIGADDPGHALLLSSVNHVLGSPAGLDRLIRLNLMINGLALLLLVSLFWFFQYRVLPALILLFAPNLLTPGPYLSGDNVAIYTAIAVFGLLPVFYLAQTTHRRFSIKSLPWVAFTIVIGAVVTCLRSSIGSLCLLTFVASLFIGLAVIPRTRLVNYLTRGFVGLFSFYLGMQAITGVFTLRDHLWEVPKSEFIRSHGFSQTLFAGLGAVENPWGHRWSDEYLAEYVDQVKPGTKAVSEGYFRILKKSYFDHWKNEPLEVIQIYLKKIWGLMGVSSFVINRGPELKKPQGSLGVFYLVVGLIWLNIWRKRRKSKMTSSLSTETRLCLIAAFISASLFLLMGLLSVPSFKYVHPVLMMNLLFIGLGLELLRTSMPIQNEIP